MHIPTSTYRIQFHKGFPLKELPRILQYLHTLGVSTLYASPITKATPGSMHGYDVTDPHTINPELGTADDLKAIIRELHKLDIQWLQDIVPNHMAFNIHNHRLMDVLERGPASEYYHYFDIDWDHPAADLNGKVMVPFLGSEIDKCLANGELRLAFGENGFAVQYFDTPWPLSISSYPFLVSALEKNNPADTVPAILNKMAAAADGADHETWQSNKREFLAAILQDEEMLGAVKRKTEDLSQDAEFLEHLFDQQYYRLAFWKETDRRINYRRFFTVNELICLRMEEEKVFDEYHAYFLKLYREKLVSGFRIDHIDGLKDPTGYTRKLRSLMGDSCYIIAEKILEAQENIPARWPLQGTSGYEFLSLSNQLLTYRKGARELLDFYHELVPGIPHYTELIFESKKLILTNYLTGEWTNLTSLFFSLGLSGECERERMKEALGMFMLCLPVYRIYPDALPARGESLLILHETFDKALQQAPALSVELRHLRRLFTEIPEDENRSEATLLFLKRLMQFTGPLTAKGVEDTTFYIYNPLISHDEVGDSPAPLGMSVQRFHDKMQTRLMRSPLSLNATATHDTKRGEDARIRINVLSRIPELWREHVTRWFDINKPFRTVVDGRTVPAVNDEYFIYQSMLGGFPEDFTVSEEWVGRVLAYLTKALREAKVNSNWSDPDEAYENGCKEFVKRIVDPAHGFLHSFIPFVRTVCEHAMVYSLTQTLIKLTAPGIPDIYQGCELWDLSFVDPDNRRAVDYEKRMEFLFQLVIREEKGKDAVFAYLAQNREAGIEKLYVTWKALNLRRSDPLLFSEGDYRPLAITGKKISAAGYARRHKDSWMLVIFPLGLARHEATDSEAEQYLILPEDAPFHWRNLFTGARLYSANQFHLHELFESFPVALLVSEPDDNSWRVSPGQKPTTF